MDEKQITDIDKLTGLDLVARVVEDVMGGKRDGTNWWYWDDGSFSVWKDVVIWRPDRDIMAAWEIWQTSVDTRPYVFAKILMAELKISDKRQLCDGIADVLIRLTPQAICRAACKTTKA